MIVIDATIAIAWAFHEEEMADQLGERLLAERLIAPALWRLEVLNVLRRSGSESSVRTKAQTSSEIWMRSGSKLST